MIRVTITTYNRHDRLARLLGCLDGEIDIVIYDDGSEPPVESDVATIYRYEDNSTKEFWYRRVRDMIDDAASDPDWEFLLWLADDLWPVEPDGFVDRLAQEFRRLQDEDPQAVCLNPLTFPEHHPTMGVDGDGWWKTGWMDCCAIVDRRFVTTARKALKGWATVLEENRGTGVGPRLGHACGDEGLTMYQFRKTWLHHDGWPSVMTPDKKSIVVL